MSHNIKNILEGRWEVICSELFTKNNKWELYQKFEAGNWWWDFQPIKHSGMGSLIEHNQGKIDSFIKYSFDIEYDKQILVIDRSHYLEDGFLDICEEEWFIIEVAENCAKNYTTCYLSLLHEPQDPESIFRYKIIAVET